MVRKVRAGATVNAVSYCWRQQLSVAVSYCRACGSSDSVTDLSNCRKNYVRPANSSHLQGTSNQTMLYAGGHTNPSPNPNPNYRVRQAANIRQEKKRRRSIFMSFAPKRMQ